MRVSLPLVLGMSWLLMPATLRADDAGESADVIDISDLNLDDLLSIPIVQGASLRSQSIVDAPVSVSFLSSEDIATLLPFKTTDLFRAVPGMFVGYTTANFAEVGARGIQLSNNNRVVSFLDGVQNQDPEVGVGRYAFSPLSPYDLHSVEVVRGSGSTFFGANAASAVVLLESRRSTNSQGLHAHFSEGLHYVPTRANESPSDPILRNGGNGYLGYGWMNEDRTFGVYGAGGFNAAPEWEEIEPTRVRHGRVQYGARLNVDWLPDSSTDLQLGLHHTFAEFDTATSSGNPAQAFAIRENRLNLRGRRSLSDELTVSVRASVRGERSSTDGILVDDLAVAVGDNESFMWNGALQLDWNGFDERNFFTAVVESRAVRVIEVAGAEQRQRFHSLVLQDELQLLDDRSLVLLAGARFASITARDIADENDTVDYRFISPRGGLLYRLSPTASLRFVGSVSYRTPNFVEVFTPFELDAFEEPVPPVAFSVTNLQLRPEQFTVFELGYRSFLSREVNLDVVAYFQRVEDLIVPNAPQIVPTFFENDDTTIHQLGLEAELGIEISDWLTLNGQYSFVQTLDEDEVFEATGISPRQSFPKHIARVSGKIGLPSDSRMTFSAWSSIDSQFLSAEFNDEVERRAYVDAPEQLWVDLRFGKFFHDGRLEVFANVRNLLGFVRQRSELRLAQSDGFAPIGASFLLGLQVTP